MDIRYREMQEKDIDRVFDFFQELNQEEAEVSFAEIESRDEIEDWIKDDRITVYVALEEDQVLGVFKSKRGGPGRDHSSFLTAAVPKKYRGYKIGQKLTHFGLEQLKKDGVKIARAYIYSNNPASVSTILKCGFSSSGCVHMHHYDHKLNRYVDDMIFHKIL